MTRTRGDPDDLASRRFGEIVLPHLADALALARWLTRSRHDAEDVVQEACIRALAAIGTYEGRGARPWLLTIVRNTCFTWLAKNRPKELVLVGTTADLDDESTAISDDDAATPETALIERADAAAVERAIAALPTPFREMIVLRDINGLSYKDIAAMLKVPIGTVMSRLARGRALLAAELKQALT